MTDHGWARVVKFWNYATLICLKFAFPEFLNSWPKILYFGNLDRTLQKYAVLYEGDKCTGIWKIIFILFRVWGQINIAFRISGAEFQYLDVRVPKHGALQHRCELIKINVEESLQQQQHPQQRQHYNNNKQQQQRGSRQRPKNLLKLKSL